MCLPSLKLIPFDSYGWTVEMHETNDGCTIRNTNGEAVHRSVSREFTAHALMSVLLTLHQTQGDAEDKAGGGE